MILYICDYRGFLCLIHQFPIPLFSFSTTTPLLLVITPFCFYYPIFPKHGSTQVTFCLPLFNDSIWSPNGSSNFQAWHSEYSPFNLEFSFISRWETLCVNLSGPLVSRYLVKHYFGCFHEECFEWDLYFLTTLLWHDWHIKSCTYLMYRTWWVWRQVYT